MRIYSRTEHPAPLQGETLMFCSFFNGAAFYMKGEPRFSPFPLVIVNDSIHRVLFLCGSVAKDRSPSYLFLDEHSGNAVIKTTSGLNQQLLLCQKMSVLTVEPTILAKAAPVFSRGRTLLTTVTHCPLARARTDLHCSWT